MSPQANLDAPATDERPWSGPLPHRKAFAVRCVACGHEYRRAFAPFCDSCGGITEAYYDLEKVRLHESENPYVRFREILPVHDASLLPKDSVHTPTIHAQRLGDELGMPRLYLKDDTRLPTGTTKDRMAAVALAYLYECGVKAFCTSSTGNSSTSYAQASPGFPHLKINVFTASDFHHRVQYRDNANIVHYVLRGASFAEAFVYSGTFAKNNGFVSERGFFNLGRREGLKMAWLEAVEQVPETIDWYVQAVSSAMGVYGTYKAARELHELKRIDRLPSLLCVQQESCCPMVQAWEGGFENILPEHIVRKPSGIAKAILRGDPSRTYPIMRKIVQEAGGSFTAVSESQIREARSMVEELEGVSPCYSASTAVAGLIKQVRQGSFPIDQTVLINLTGGDRPVDENQAQHQDIRWLSQSHQGWTPDDAARENGLIHGDEPLKASRT